MSDVAAVQEFIDRVLALDHEQQNAVRQIIQYWDGEIERPDGFTPIVDGKSFWFVEDDVLAQMRADGAKGITVVTADGLEPLQCA